MGISQLRMTNDQASFTIVAQSFTLLYRRFSICVGKKFSELTESHSVFDILCLLLDLPSETDLCFGGCCRDGP